MTVEEFEVLQESEAEHLLRVRLRELIAAGFDWDQALVLATHIEVDPERARDLLRRGCPAETALRILL